MKAVFIDTGPLLARYLQNDQYHKQAIKSWQSIENKKLYTTNHVLDEFITLLARRASYSFAAQRAESIFNSKVLNIIYSTREDESLALTLFTKFSSYKVSFTDAISFAVLKKFKVDSIFTYDQHFSHLGIEIIGDE
jgi:predicted nucleic acid-binding protein